MSEVAVMGNRKKLNYSPMERAIFAALQRGPATNNQLIRPLYRKREEPFNAAIVVNRAVITLGQKLKRNGEDFRILRKKLPKRRLIENSLVRK